MKVGSWRDFGYFSHRQLGHVLIAVAMLFVHRHLMLEKHDAESTNDSWSVWMRCWFWKNHWTFSSCCAHIFLITIRTKCNYETHSTEPFRFRTFGYGVFWIMHCLLWNHFDRSGSSEEVDPVGRTWNTASGLRSDAIGVGGRKCETTYDNFCPTWNSVSFITTFTEIRAGIFGKLFWTEKVHPMIILKTGGKT